MTYVSKPFDMLTPFELYEIMQARERVFLLEQNIVCQDLDGVDLESRHIFLKEHGKLIAYLRAFYNSQDTVSVGRVLTLERSVGNGKTLMQRAIEDIKNTMPCKRIILNSQCHAEGFYKKLGFVTVSEPFIEEGVPHVKMELVF